MNEVNCSESDAAKRSVFDQVVMPHDAVMLRPVRFVGENDIKLYDPVEFKSGKEGCELYFRRCKVFGGIATSKEETVGLCDILNKDFDITPIEISIKNDSNQSLKHQYFDTKLKTYYIPRCVIKVE
mgnify:CR=1 FL=1